ncbi:MAG TPA: hypothetical protein VFF00_01580, partial [Candidatus Elarobacter sp.]|nr:hypothetical protein [Candidatus Elarobacter sp.]
MRRIAFVLALSVGALTWLRPAAGAPLRPWDTDPCATTRIEAVYRLPDDAKGARYYVRLRDAARNFPGSGTVRLDTRTEHLVAPFDGSALIVRAPLEHDVVAAAVASVHALGEERVCPLHPLTGPPIEASETAVIRTRR